MHLTTECTKDLFKRLQASYSLYLVFTFSHKTLTAKASLLYKCLDVVLLVPALATLVT